MTDNDMNIGEIVPKLLMEHPAVRSAALTGSRMRGDATEWSDWDFLIEVTDFEAVSAALPTITKSLEPLSHLWDPLSRHAVYMMILRGPAKIDIIFDRPHEKEPPWTINSDTIVQVNSHFWDWILWIASKEARGMKDTVGKEFEKMYDYLLAPIGCPKSPASVEGTVRDYLAALEKQRRLLNVEVDPALEMEVIKGLRTMGFQIGFAPENDEI
jgi:predicted nucleotidyltransferase